MPNKKYENDMQRMLRRQFRELNFNYNNYCELYYHNSKLYNFFLDIKERMKIRYLSNDSVVTDI